MGGTAMLGLRAFERDRIAAACMTGVLLLAGGTGPRAAPGQSDGNADVSAIGFVLRPLTRSGAPGDDATDAGAEVEAVTPNRPAAAAGIVPGDVIVRIGGQPVGAPKDVATGIRTDRESGRM